MGHSTVSGKICIKYFVFSGTWGIRNHKKKWIIWKPSSLNVILTFIQKRVNNLCRFMIWIYLDSYSWVMTCKLLMQSDILKVSKSLVIFRNPTFMLSKDKNDWNLLLKKSSKYSTISTEDIFEQKETSGHHSKVTKNCIFFMLVLD